jgi:glycosyltransferase involved in cell wall biosynthesis
MNICVVTSTFPTNKQDVMKAPFLAPLVEQLQRNGHRVFVLTQEGSGPTEDVFPGVEVHRFRWRQVDGNLAEISFRTPRNALAALSLVFAGALAVRRLAVARRIDLFLGLWVVPAGLYLYPLKVLGLLRAPYFLWALGSDINKYKGSLPARFLLRRILRGASAVFAAGFELARDVERIADVRCEFLSAFRKLPEPDNEPRPAGDLPTFIYVGRHTKVKGIDILIDAVELLKSRSMTRFRLTVASEGEMTPLLKDRVQREGLASLIKFTGKLTSEGLRDLYLASDCVVIPSRSEGFPLVFGEALQMGRPLIVADVAGMGELGTRHGVAWAVPKEDPAALADALAAFIERPFAPDERGRKALLELLAFENSVKTLLKYIACSQSEAASRQSPPTGLRSSHT